MRKIRSFGYMWFYRHYYTIKKTLSDLVNKGLFKIINYGFSYDSEGNFNSKRMFYLVKKI